MKEIDRESKVRKLARPLMAKAFFWLGGVDFRLSSYTAAFGPPVTLKHRSLHVAMMLVMGFIMYTIQPKIQLQRDQLAGLAL
jgi:TRAP-type uncharacterized transport system fused permease subunit